MNSLVEEITEGFYLLRLDDDETRFFEALWEIPEGITYNSYLLRSGNHTVLFDTWKKGFEDKFIRRLKEIVDPSKIDFIVVHHTEPGHSGCIGEVLEANGYKAEVIGHPLVKSMLASFYGSSPRFKAVKDGETLDLDGLKLRFIYTPWLHWPETIMTYIEDRGLLLSGDAFGSYFIPGGIYDDEIPEDYLWFARKYFANVIGHYRQRVKDSIEKIMSGLNLKVNIIAPLHGLIWRKNPALIVEKYVGWADATPESGKILVVYSSMYGNVKEAVEKAVGMLEEKGLKPVVFRFTGREQARIADIVGEALDSHGIIVGAATYENQVFPKMAYVIDLLARKTSAEKPVLIVSSYGWGGIAARKMSEVLGDAGFKIAGIVEFRGGMDKEDQDKLAESIRKFSAMVKGEG